MPDDVNVEPEESTKDDDAFDAAFKEHAEKDDELGETIDRALDENDTTDSDDDDSADVDDEPEADEPDDEADSEDDDGDTEDDPPDEVKMWDGRLQATRNELSERQAELARVNAEIAAKATTPESSDAEGASDEELPEILQDFPEYKPGLDKYIDERSKANAQEVVQPNTQSIEQIQQQQATNHYGAIEADHPGWREEFVESGALNKWMNNLPHHQALKYQEVAGGGTASQVSEMLTECKNSMTAKAKRKPKVSKRGNNSAVSPSGKQSRQMGYNESWDHHASQADS